MKEKRRGESPVAIITGASGPIGQATVQRLAGTGFRLILADRSDEELKKIETDLRAKQIACVVTKFDTADESEAQRIADAALSSFGAIDVLVNGLAASHPIDWLDMPSKELGGLMEEHTKWPLLCTRAVIPPMIAAGGGRIVNVVLSLGRYRSAYFRANGSHDSEVITAAGDGALFALTRQLAFELASHRIRVNAVAVGLIRSPATETAWRKLSARQQAFLIEEISLRRFGEPDEVAAAIEFLAGEASSYVTGTAIDVNGGWWMS